MCKSPASPNFIYKDTAHSPTLVVDPDIPINSVEVCHGLGTPSAAMTLPVPLNATGLSLDALLRTLFEPC
ncbi:hypothetical protein KCU78_g6202, partial [Aureobasidium melanogenum]